MVILENLKLFLAEFFAEKNKTISKNLTNGRVISYDIIRVLAFILIVVHHVVLTSIDKFGQEGYWYLHTGALGVSLFIVLSGCSLGLSSKNTTVLTFYKKRFLSIFPSYWTAYIIVVLFLFAFLGILSVGSQPLKILFTIVGQDGYLHSKYKTYYLIGEWFTGFILLVYLIAPAILAGMRRHPVITLISTLFLSYFSIQYNDVLFDALPVWHKVALWNPTARLFEFAAGVGISYFLIKSKKRLCVIGILSAVILAILCILKQSLLQFTFLGTIIGVLIIIVLTALFEFLPAKNERFIQKISFFSKYSFAAFLFHHKISDLIISRAAYGHLDGNFIFFSVFAVIVLSYLTAYYAEKPASVLRNLLKQKLFPSNSKAN